MEKTVTDLLAGAPRRGDVAIYTGRGWAEWSPHDIERRGLGGSETGVVKLAERLARCGYAVSVFGDVDETVYRDVAFRRWETFEPMEPRLVTISSRIPWLFDRPSASCLRMLWATDIDYGADLTVARAESTHLVVVPSRWHERHIVARYPFLEGKLRVVPNGIEHSYFADRSAKREPRVLYTTAPDRGLDVVLDLWPDVRRQVPDAELAFCYAPVYDARAERTESLAQLHRHVDTLSKQPGVIRMGSLSQPELARVMTQSRVWVAPSWCTPCGKPVLETYCIGAVEAQAAGCCVVASAVGALTETVRFGYLVKAKPDGARWRRDFTDAIVAGLRDPAVQHRAEVEGPRAVQDLGWSDATAQMVALIETGLGLRAGERRAVDAQP